MKESEILEYWMSLIDDKEVLQIWNDILDENDPLRKIPEGFFSMFRPNGEGLDRFFEKVHKGDKILKRLLEIYETTSQQYDPSDWYFVVRYPQLASRKDIETVALKYVANVIEMAVKVGDSYFGNFISNKPDVQVIEGIAPEKTTDMYSEFDLDCGVYELIHEFTNSITPEESYATFFEEPLYQIACRYDIAYYVLWPLYENKSRVIDPFKPFIELWKYNATLRFDADNNILMVYVAKLRD